MIVRMDMTDEEYAKAIEEIVASGRGLEAIKAISQREILYRDLSASTDRPTKCIAEIKIDNDDLIKRIKEEYELTDRPHGEWIITKEGEYDGRSVYKTECSECGHETFYKANNAHYCPNCGALMSMRGEEE